MIISSAYFYLHGFASSPRSTKAQDLHQRFASLGLELPIPDLNQGDFPHLTLSRQIRQVQLALPPETVPVTLIGSSFGGLTAAWVAQQRHQVERLVLLAPAFGFLSHWLPRLSPEQRQQWKLEGFLEVYHYGEAKMLPLHYAFVEDAASYDEIQLRRPVPTLILHGRQDEVIPIQASRNFADDRPWVKLVELDSDHALLDVGDEIWQAIREFCAF